MEKQQVVASKEVLTPLKMVELFGVNSGDVILYDFDKNAWNRDNYVGYSCNKVSFSEDANSLRIMKCVLETDLRFAGLEVVAAVTMVVKNYPGWGRVVKNPVFDVNSGNVVGTVILRDRKTGKILARPSSWLGIFDYGYVYGAVNGGMRGFAYDTLHVSKYRDRLIASNCR